MLKDLSVRKRRSQCCVIVLCRLAQCMMMRYNCYWAAAARLRSTSLDKATLRLHKARTMLAGAEAKLITAVVGTTSNPNRPVALRVFASSIAATEGSIHVMCQELVSMSSVDQGLALNTLHLNQDMVCEALTWLNKQEPGSSDTDVAIAMECDTCATSSDDGRDNYDPLNLRCPDRVPGCVCGDDGMSPDWNRPIDYDSDEALRLHHALDDTVGQEKLCLLTSGSNTSMWALWLRLTVT